MASRRALATLGPLVHRRAAPAVKPTSLCPRCQLRRQSVSQRPGSDRVHFPGAVNSSFTSALSFTRPSEKDAMPTFRILDQDGEIVDQSQNHPETSKEELLKMYKDMVTVSIMDIIMFDAQRQGRISFYMVSAGEDLPRNGSTLRL
ncbi:hypothetical protein KC366_g13107 [Hortaea werneckii]|nr:hypothetical protein KC366_g13107 [Hortaea werneckii]